jgi:hypothetical protein
MRKRQMAERKKDRFAKMRSWMSRDNTADSNIAADSIGLDLLRDLCETSAHFAIKGFFLVFRFATASSASPPLL